MKCEKISKVLKFNYNRIELEKISSTNSTLGDMKIEVSQLENILNSLKI